MQLNPIPFTPQAIKPQPLASPTAQAAVITAALVSQSTAPPTRTQTVQATQASGKTDQTRNAQTGTDTGHAKDTLAAATFARTNGTGYRAGPRGSNLDVSV